MKRCIFLLVFLLLVSCTLTEQQVQDIAQMAGEAAGGAIKVTAPYTGIGPEAAGGVAAAVTAGVAFLLAKLKKKNGQPPTT